MLELAKVFLSYWSVKMIVGKTDSFERRYMEKFRQFASAYGEFVSYERDRGARDIGLHFTKH